MGATKAEAYIVLKEVENLYAEYIEAMETKPELMKGAAWNGGDGWTVCWEEGPYEWAAVFPTAMSGIGDGYQHFDEDDPRNWEQIEERLRYYDLWTEAWRNYQLGIYRWSEQ